MSTISEQPTSARKGLGRRRSLLCRARGVLIDQQDDGGPVDDDNRRAGPTVRRRASLLERGGRPVIRSISKIGRR